MNADVNYMDHVEEEDNYNEDRDGRVPRTNAAQMEVEMADRNPVDCPESWYSAPMHVLFNQLGSLCSRFNSRIKGSQFQQHFVQSIVSRMRGFSFPLLYITGMLFPKHFWSTPSNDPSAILGVMPISTYRKKLHADGFASHLQMARTYATSSSSSTSTDHNFVSHLFDTLANRAQSGTDSRDYKRRGFKVSQSSDNGIVLGEADDSRLTQSLDSKQAARNLAAASQFVGFDVFFTFTMNASQHPGVRHLFDWKKSMRWTDQIENYRTLTTTQKLDVEKSFEMAYTCILNRNWLETRQFLLDLLIHGSRNILGRDTIEAFFRDEYQESAANVCHLHGLASYSKEDLDNEQFKEWICSLQRSAVCDLVLTTEIDEYVREGLFSQPHDWNEFVKTGMEVLRHICDDRCKRVVDTTGDEQKDLKCRKPHPVFDSVDPLKDEFIPLPFKFNPECLRILTECGFWEEPSERFPNGRMLLDSLQPRRHSGKVTPSARENMSPVFPKLFALTMSTQNAQIVTNCNGVGRYVVKYLVK